MPLLARVFVAALAGIAAAASFEPIRWVYLLPFAVAALTVATLGTTLRRGFLVALGVWLAHRTTVPMIGLPTMDLFRRTESARLLEGARRRLGR